MIRAATFAAVTVAGLASFAAFARPVAFEFPVGKVPSELAGTEAEVVANNCSGCHSLDYITTQPRGKGEKFWRDSVTKMVTVYKAPITPEDAAKVAAVLAGKFG